MKHDEHVVRQACLMFLHQLALQPEFRAWVRVEVDPEMPCTWLTARRPAFVPGWIWQ
jgi:hypothetical protein